MFCDLTPKWGGISGVVLQVPGGPYPKKQFHNFLCHALHFTWAWTSFWFFFCLIDSNSALRLRFMSALICVQYLLLTNCLSWRHLGHRAGSPKIIITTIPLIDISKEISKGTLARFAGAAWARDEETKTERQAKKPRGELSIRPYTTHVVLKILYRPSDSAIGSLAIWSPRNSE